METKKKVCEYCYAGSEHQYAKHDFFQYCLDISQAAFLYQAYKNACLFGSCVWPIVYVVKYVLQVQMFTHWEQHDVQGCVEESEERKQAKGATSTMISTMCPLGTKTDVVTL